MEEQRKQKQKALVDNEQLRDELERLQKAKLDSDRTQRLYVEAESRCRQGLWAGRGLLTPGCLLGLSAGEDTFHPPMYSMAEYSQPGRAQCCSHSCGAKHQWEIPEPGAGAGPPHVQQPGPVPPVRCVPHLRVALG